MGKRKRATKPPPKKKSAKLEKIFDCPFCGHEQTVDCVIQRDIKLGRVQCRICGVKYSAIINSLEEEIDVYSKWIDACEDANRDPVTTSKPVSTTPDPDTATARAVTVADVHEADEED